MFNLPGALQNEDMNYNLDFVIPISTLVYFFGRRYRPALHLRCSQQGEIVSNSNWQFTKFLISRVAVVGEIVIYRRWDDCHALYLEFLMRYGLRAPVNVANWIYSTYL